MPIQEIFHLISHQICAEVIRNHICIISANMKVIVFIEIMLVCVFPHCLNFVPHIRIWFRPRKVDIHSSEAWICHVGSSEESIALWCPSINYRLQVCCMCSFICIHHTKDSWLALFWRSMLQFLSPCPLNDASSNFGNGGVGYFINHPFYIADLCSF